MTLGAAMPREAKYDILFEPVQLGPKTLRNRFWQVPHCNGAGSDRPGFQAAFRGMKAEGGWGAVFTEVCTISPGGDVMPWVASKLWDDGDVRNLAQMTEAIHAHDALAGVELCHPGGLAANAETRAPASVVSQIASDINYLANGRQLSRREIAALRREHVKGFKRARAAGFDLLTLYAGLGTFPIYFLYPFYNKRTDEYGGAFENRIRFTREVLEDIRGEIDDVAIGVRFVMDTLEDPYGYGDLGVRAGEEGTQFIAALDHLVDYWDLNIGTLNWGEDAGSSRFFESNHEAPYTRVAKQVTAKPCVNVGRFTDPTSCWRPSGPASATSSAPPGPRSPTRSCRRRSRKAGSKTSASASAATCACPAGRWAAPRSGAPRTPPAARNTAAAGIRNDSAPPATRTSRC